MSVNMLIDETAAVVAPAAAQREALQHGWKVLAVLSALMGFAAISTDFYLPAMPTMAVSLQANQGLIDWTISAYLIGFSIGQLFWGPIGDRYGRRLPVAIGLVLFILGSIGCALSSSAWMLIGWRIVQSLGACASVVLSRAMVRDLYAGERAAQMLSNLITVMAVAPLLGPIIGGQILAISGWRAIFWVLVAIGFITLGALFTLPETLPPSHRNREPLTHAFAAYRQLLSDRRLLAYIGLGSCFYGAVYAYIAGTPFAYINFYHVSPQLYGLLFGLGIVGIMATNVINSRLVVRFGPNYLLKIGTLIFTCSAVVLAVTATTGFGGLLGIVLPLLLIVSMNGLIVANAIALALAGFPERAGMVSALVGAAQYGAGIFTTALVGICADGTPWSMAIVILACGLIALWFVQLINKPTEGENHDN